MKFKISPKSSKSSEKTSAEKISKFKQNKILNIIICVLFVFAIFAIILLSLLDSKIKQLYTLNNTLSEGFGRISLKLDEDSGTHFGRNFNTALFRNPETVANALMTQYRQADEIIKQRNKIAEQIIGITQALKLPQISSPQQIESLVTSKDALINISSEINKVNERNDKLINYLVQIANTVGLNQADIQSLKEDNSKYSQSYPSLEKLLNSAQTLKSNLVNAQNSVQELTQNLQTLQTSYNSATAEDNSLKSKLADLQQQITLLKTENEQLKQNQFTFEKQELKAQSEQQLSPNESEQYLKLKGEVVEYNPKWGFAIINLGSLSSISEDVNGSLKTVKVPVKVGLTVNITRDNKFIAKGDIVEVFDNYSVVNIVFPLNSDVQKNDQISVPKQ